MAILKMITKGKLCFCIFFLYFLFYTRSSRSDGVMYDDKSVEAWGETWRSWENDDDEQCALNDQTILPESVSWFRWVDKLKSRPDAALPTCTDDQELLS